MRITYIAQDIDSVTGVGRIALAYARGMTAAGHDVDLICQRCSSDGQRARRIPGFPALPSVDKFLFRIGEPVASRPARGDIRHAFGIGSRAHVVSAQSCHRSGVEMQRALPAGRIRSRNFGMYDRLSLQDEARLMTSPDTRIILAVSGMVRDQLLHWYAIPPEKIVVVPNGIDVSRFTVPLDLDLVRREYGMRPDRLAVGFLGNEFERKGVQTIIEALPLLGDIPLDVIVAGADDPGPFRLRAEQLGVSDQVRFVGRVTNPEKFLRSLDLFAFPVNYEPFGMVVIEAMAAGVPVITARAVGAIEGTTDGHHAIFLDDPLSAGELATQVRRVLDDRQLRDRLATEGRAAAMAFAWPRIISDIESLYRMIAGDSRSAAGSNVHSRNTPR
jgi:glycosyltransferase involved in cell wall biosynthesis